MSTLIRRLLYLLPEVALARVPHGVLSLAMSLAQIRPAAGGSPEGDEEDSQDDGDDESSTEESDDGDEAEADDEDKFVRMPKAEADALRREVAETRRTAKKAKAEAERAATDRAKEQGKWKELAEEAEAKAEEANRQLESFQRRQRVSSVASRLKFRDPQDAARFLDGDDLDDENSVEASLKRLAREKPYLVERPARSGGDLNDGESDEAVEPGLDRLRRAYSQ